MRYPSICKAALTFLSSLLILSLCGFGRAQSESRKGSPAKADSKQTEEVDLIRWRAMLDQLSDEARSFSEQESRPLLMAEVADAYWALDKDRSNELFALAFNAAVDLRSDPKNPRTAVSRVLSLAARRSDSLAKKLTDRLAEVSAEDPRLAASSVQAAFDLLESSPEAAIRLAEAGATLALSTDAAGMFILQLARRDLPAAEKVYRACLSKLSNTPRVPIGSLMWLGGFPFGYGESYGFTSRNLRVSGTGGQQIPGLRSNQALASAFLDLTLISVRNTVATSLSAPPQLRDAMNGIALFVVTYLFPEVERYRPAAAAEWQLLYQQTLSATPPVLQQEVNNQMQLVLGNRASAAKRSQASNYDSSEAGSDALARSANLPEGCERDRGYAEAALKIAAAKDYARARAAAEKVQDLTTRKNVQQFMTYELATAAIEKGDLAEAQRLAAQIDIAEQRILLYVKTAAAALSQEDPVLVGILLSEMRRKSSSVADESARVAVLIAAATIYSEFDPLMAIQTLKEAVKALNQSSSRNIDTFSVLRKVNLVCPGDKYERWFGTSDNAERFSILETIAELSKTDVDGCIAIGEGIEDRATRIRALIAIAAAALEK